MGKTYRGKERNDRNGKGKKGKKNDKQPQQPEIFEKVERQKNRFDRIIERSVDLNNLRDQRLQVEILPKKTTVQQNNPPKKDFEYVQESLFSIPVFNGEVTAVTVISLKTLSMRRIFDLYPRDLAIAVMPFSGKQRFISIIFNRNSDIQDKDGLMKLLVNQLVRSDMTVKDKRWLMDKERITGFTTLTELEFIGILAECFKRIKLEEVSGVDLSKCGSEILVRAI